MLQAELGDGLQSALSIQLPHLSQYRFTRAIQDDQGGHPAHAILLSELTAHGRVGVQMDRLHPLRFEFSFDPVHDGLGQVAGASSVAVKVKQRRLTRDQGRQFVRGSEIGRLAAQSQVARAQRDQDEQQQRIFTEPAPQTAHWLFTSANTASILLASTFLGA